MPAKALELISFIHVPCIIYIYIYRHTHTLSYDMRAAASMNSADSPLLRYSLHIEIFVADNFFSQRSSIRLIQKFIANIRKVKSGLKYL
jgi:hypothetical protein